MTAIKAITETKRGRFALFSDAGFLFSVDEETLAKSGLTVDDVLDDAALEDLKEQSETRRAKNRALGLLARRAHGSAELAAKLARHHDEYTCAAVVAWLLENALLDDAAFARDKAEALAMRGKSRREIGQRLVALGMDRDHVDDALCQLEDHDAGAALAVVRKSYMRQLENGDKEKVMAALARRGFSRGHSLAAIRLAMGEDTE